MSYEVVARPLRVAVLTVSDTRTLETDKGGNKVQPVFGGKFRVCNDNISYLTKKTAHYEQSQHIIL